MMKTLHQLLHHIYLVCHGRSDGGVCPFILYFTQGKERNFMAEMFVVVKVMSKKSDCHYL